MKTLLTPSRTLAVPLLLGCIGTAVAQSLGPSAAEAWIGRPFEMTVPVRFTSADSGEECVHAEVFYGDTRVRADRVRTTVFGPLLQRKIRVATDAPVDEPVVTVSLRAGCRGSITRSYTLLPGLATPETVASQEGKESGWAGARPLGPAAMAARLSSSLAPRIETAAAAPRASTGKGTAARARRAKDLHRVSAPASKPTSPQGPRLKLEPLDFDPPALLRVSDSLSQPEGDASKRAAAALLWQALNADPQEILRTSAMLQKLEHDLVVLRQADGQTRAELAALRQRLDAPAPWHRSAGLVQVLLLLLGAASALAGVLWMRTRRWSAATPSWYETPRPEHASDAAAALVQELAAPQPAAGPIEPAWRPDPAPSPAAASAIPLSSHADAVDDAAPAQQSVPEPQAVQAAARVETLAATFGELEFLAAVGSSRHAVEVLEGYLAGSTSPSPLAFFELMRLHAREDDANALAALRLRYRELFGQEAPSVEEVTAAVGLEALQDLSAGITGAWGTPAAVHLIEQSLFQPEAAGAALTLQAGRELLSLYELAVAIASGAAEAGEAQADAHPIAPWAQAEEAAQAQMALDVAADAEDGSHSGVDVDLSVSAAPPVQERAPLEFAPFLAELQAEAQREAAERAAAERAAAEQEEAFSAAVAFERVPVSRY